MPNERYLMVQLHELLSYLAEMAVVSILVSAQHGLIGAMQAPVDVSYLADTVILTRFFEIDGRLKKAVSAIKHRKGRHEQTIRELTIGPEGLHIGAPLADFHGVLTGSPVFNPNQPTIPKDPE
jgi:circadian clock protein KaiC